MDILFEISNIDYFLYGSKRIQSRIVGREIPGPFITFFLRLIVNRKLFPRIVWLNR